MPAINIEKDTKTNGVREFIVPEFHWNVMKSSRFIDENAMKAVDFIRDCKTASLNRHMKSQSRLIAPPAAYVRYVIRGIVISTPQGQFFNAQHS